MRLFMTGWEHGVDGVSLPITTSVGQTVWDTFPTGSIVTTPTRGSWSEYAAKSGRLFFPDLGELYVGFGLLFTETLPTGTVTDWITFTSNGTTQLRLSLQSDGTIRVQRTGSGTTLLGVTTEAFVPDQWYFVEVHYVPHTTSGTVTLRVDGVDWFTISAVRTSNASNTVNDMRNIYTFTGPSGTGTSDKYLDDIVLHDTTGAEDISWPGEVKIGRHMVPDGYGDVTQLSVSGAQADNWDAVNDVPATGGDEVHSPTQDEYDLYAMGNPTGISNVQRGFVMWYRVRGTPTTSNVSWASMLKSEGSEWQGSDFALSASVNMRGFIHVVDPIDSAAWTMVKLEALQCGFKARGTDTTVERRCSQLILEVDGVLALGGDHWAWAEDSADSWQVV